MLRKECVILVLVVTMAAGICSAADGTDLLATLKKVRVDKGNTLTAEFHAKRIESELASGGANNVRVGVLKYPDGLATVYFSDAFKGQSCATLKKSAKLFHEITKIQLESVDKRLTTFMCDDDATPMMMYDKKGSHPMPGFCK